MDLLNCNLGILTRENLIQKFLRSLLRERTILATFHVQAFDFELVDILAINLGEVDCSILLLRMQQKSSEDIVNVDFQELVPVINGSLEFVANLQCFCNAVGIGVDHDRVSVTIYDL